MTHPHRFPIFAASAAAAAAMLAGCASDRVPPPPAAPAAQLGVEPRVVAADPGAEAPDLVSVADRMARSILVVPAIANAKGTPRVVLEPVVNNTRLPFDEKIFLTRLRTQLNGKSLGRVRFLDRAMMRSLQRERALRRSGAAAFPAPEPAEVEFGGPDFVLSGRIDRLVASAVPGVGDPVVYRFQLTDARTRALVWEDSAEIRTQGLEDAAYR
jgi:PBP1b-binding outer membrane lipoprotein LpoB